MICSSQAKIRKTELAYRELGCFDPKGVSKAFSAKSRICFSPSTMWRKAGVRFTLRAVQSEAVRSEKVSGSSRMSKSVSGFPGLIRLVVENGIVESRSKPDLLVASQFIP